MPPDALTTAELFERQRRYDEIARQLNGGVAPDPRAPGSLAFHNRIMDRLDGYSSDCWSCQAGECDGHREMIAPPSGLPPTSGVGSPPDRRTLLQWLRENFT